MRTTISIDNEAFAAAQAYAKARALTQALGFDPEEAA